MMSSPEPLEEIPSRHVEGGPGSEQIQIRPGAELSPQDLQTVFRRQALAALALAGSQEDDDGGLFYRLDGGHGTPSR